MPTQAERDYYNGPAGEHEHIWSAEVEHGYLTGNPHRHCTVEGCKHITLDLSDDADTDGEEQS
jgi:hypothetical protein